MPSFEIRDRTQKAVWWARTGTNRFGQPVVGSPVEIKARWLDKRSERRQPDGSTVTIEGTVILDREVSDGDILWKGGMDEITDPGHVPLSGLMQVYSFNSTPDIKGRNTRYEATFMRFNDVLPVT